MASQSPSTSPHHFEERQGVQTPRSSDRSSSGPAPTSTDTPLSIDEDSYSHKHRPKPAVQSKPCNNPYCLLRHVLPHPELEKDAQDPKIEVHLVQPIGQQRRQHRLYQNRQHHRDHQTVQQTPNLQAAQLIGQQRRQHRLYHNRQRHRDHQTFQQTPNLHAAQPVAQNWRQRRLFQNRQHHRDHQIFQQTPKHHRRRSRRFRHHKDEEENIQIDMVNQQDAFTLPVHPSFIHYPRNHQQQHHHNGHLHHIQAAVGASSAGLDTLNRSDIMAHLHQPLISEPLLLRSSRNQRHLGDPQVSVVLDAPIDASTPYEAIAQPYPLTLEAQHLRPAFTVSQLQTLRASQALRTKSDASSYTESKMRTLSQLKKLWEVEARPTSGIISGHLEPLKRTEHLTPEPQYPHPTLSRPHTLSLQPPEVLSTFIASSNRPTQFLTSDPNNLYPARIQSQPGKSQKPEVLLIPSDDSGQNEAMTQLQPLASKLKSPFSTYTQTQSHEPQEQEVQPTPTGSSVQDKTESQMQLLVSEPVHLRAAGTQSRPEKLQGPEVQPAPTDFSGQHEVQPQRQSNHSYLTSLQKSSVPPTPPNSPDQTEASAQLQPLASEMRHLHPTRAESQPENQRGPAFQPPRPNSNLPTALRFFQRLEGAMLAHLGKKQGLQMFPEPHFGLVDDDSDSDTDSDRQTESDSDTDSDRQTESDSDTDSDRETESDSDTDSDRDTESNSDTESDRVTEAVMRFPDSHVNSEDGLGADEVQNQFPSRQFSHVAGSSVTEQIISYVMCMSELEVEQLVRMLPSLQEFHV